MFKTAPKREPFCVVLLLGILRLGAVRLAQDDNVSAFVRGRMIFAPTESGCAAAQDDNVSAFVRGRLIIAPTESGVPPLRMTETQCLRAFMQPSV